MRTLRRLGRTVIPLLAAWLFLSSCSLGASTQQSSGTLVMGLGTEPATLNPFEAADKSSVRALSPMFPNLYQLAPDLRVTPDLAAAMPQLSRDRKVWTVRLRHDARERWQADHRR